MTAGLSFAFTRTFHGGDTILVWLSLKIIVEIEFVFKPKLKINKRKKALPIQ